MKNSAAVRAVVNALQKGGKELNNLPETALNLGKKDVIEIKPKMGLSIEDVSKKPTAFSKKDSPTVGKTVEPKGETKVGLSNRISEGFQNSDSEVLIRDASKLPYKDYVKKHEAYNLDGGGMSKADKPAHAVINKYDLVPTEIESWKTFKTDTTEKFSKEKSYTEAQKYEKDFAPPLVEDIGGGKYAVIDGHHRVANIINNGGEDIPVYFDRRTLQKKWESANNKKISTEEGNSIYKELYPQLPYKPTAFTKAKPNSASEAVAKGLTEEQYVKGQLDPLREFKTGVGIKDPDIARGTVKEAIDDIGGIDNVRRGEVSINKLEKTENINTRSQRYKDIEKDVKSGNITPIITDEYLRVVDGHHRLEVYRSLNMDNIPVIVPKMTPSVKFKTTSQLRTEYQAAKPKTVFGRPTSER